MTWALESDPFGQARPSSIVAAFSGLCVVGKNCLCVSLSLGHFPSLQNRKSSFCIRLKLQQCSYTFALGDLQQLGPFTCHLTLSQPESPIQLASLTCFCHLCLSLALCCWNFE